MNRLALLCLLAACAGGRSQPKKDAPSADNQAQPASASPIALSIATHGSELELTLKNASTAAQAVAVNVKHAHLDYDWLVVELFGPDGKTRTMRFLSDRDESARVVTGLEPGAIDVERLDLAWWAIRPGNGGALEPGHYEVKATWDATKEPGVAQFVAEATTTLDIPAPDEHCAKDGYVAPAGAKVELLAYQPGPAATAAVGIHNAGTEAVCVWDRIATHELQSDWLVIQYSDGAEYHHFNRVLRLDDSRDKSAPASVLLPPGATAWTTWDVAQWAARDRNGAEPLPSGSLWALAVYDTSKETEVWAGRVEAQFELRAP